MDLDSVADELFGVPLNDFTGVRNERSKQARADGDRDLAKEIQALRKPTTSAWLVNQLSRHHRDDLEPLLELGRDLREAGALLSGDDLRALTRQRHQVVHALVQVTRRFGADRGLKVSSAVADEVRETLEASLADPDASAAVLAGRLTQPLQQVGFGVVEPSGAGPRGRSVGQSAGQSGRSTDEPAGQAQGQPAAEVADLERRRRERAERKVEQTERALEQAESSRQRAAQEQRTATEAREAADSEVERLRTELERAQQAASTAAEEEQDKDGRARRAEQKVRDAEQALDRARTELDELGD